MKRINILLILLLITIGCTKNKSKDSNTVNAVHRLSIFELQNVLYMDYTHVKDFFINNGYNFITTSSNSCVIHPSKTLGFTSIMIFFNKNKVQSVSFKSEFDAPIPEDPCYWSKEDCFELIIQLMKLGYVLDKDYSSPKPPNSSYYLSRSYTKSISSHGQIIQTNHASITFKDKGSIYIELSTH